MRIFIPLTLLLIASPASAESIHLTLQPAGGDAPTPLSVTDARPDWQKKKDILSLMRTACDFAITRWGDADSAPSRAEAVAIGLARHLDSSFRDKPIKLTWFTLHTNRRAPATHVDPDEKGLVYDALRSGECRKGAEMIGGVGPDEVSPPAPLVIDIVVEVDGRAYAGRAVASIAETTIASAQLMDQAFARLAKSIEENVPVPTPCERLKAALDAAPQDKFYRKSYGRYCAR